MHRRILLALAAAAVFGGALFLFRSGDRQDVPPPDALLPIRIANIGIYSNYNILAEELGLFEKNGLSAEVIEYDSGATTMDAVVAGDVDVGVAASFVGARRIFTDDDVRILATVSAHQVFHVLGRKDRGMERPHDISGKRVGVTLSSAGEF
jgi:NitT/TauT family transport system substrate-binding protein